jgi:hypothetical protein
MVLCAYGITAEGKRELIDYLIVKAEGEDTCRVHQTWYTSRCRRAEYYSIFSKENVLFHERNASPTSAA